MVKCGGLSPQSDVDTHAVDAEPLSLNGDDGMACLIRDDVCILDATERVLHREIYDQSNDFTNCYTPSPDLEIIPQQGIDLHSDIIGVGNGRTTIYVRQIHYCC